MSEWVRSKMTRELAATQGEDPAHGSKDVFMQYCEPIIYNLYADIVDTYTERGFFGSKRYGEFLKLVIDNVDVRSDPSFAIEF